MNAKIVILIAALACTASANVRRLPTFGFSSNLGSAAEGRPTGGFLSNLIPSFGGFEAQVQTIPELAGQLQQAALGGVEQGMEFAQNYAGQGMGLAQNLAGQGMGLAQNFAGQGMGFAQNLAEQVSNGIEQGMHQGQLMIQQGMGLGQQLQQAMAGKVQDAFALAAQVGKNVQGGMEQFAKFTQDMANAALTGMKNVMAQGKNVMTGLISIRDNFMNKATEGAEQVAAIFNQVIAQGTTALNPEDMITQLQNLAQSGSRPAQQAIAQISALTASMGGNNAQQVQQAMNNLYAGVQGLAHQGRPLAAQFAGQIQNAATGFQQAFQGLAQQAAQQAVNGVQQIFAGAQQAAQQAVNGAQQIVAGTQHAAEQAAQQAVAIAEQAAAVAQEAAQEAFEQAVDIAEEAQQVQAQVLPVAETFIAPPALVQPIQPVAPQTLVAQPAIAVQPIQPAVVEA